LDTKEQVYSMVDRKQVIITSFYQLKDNFDQFKDLSVECRRNVHRK